MENNPEKKITVGDPAMELALAAGRFTAERDFWLNKLSGPLNRVHLPYGRNIPGGRVRMRGRKHERAPLELPPETQGALARLSRGSDANLHMILTAAVVLLLNRYTGAADITVGTPIYIQREQAAFTNTAIPLRLDVTGGMSFKDLLLQVRTTLTEAVKNQAYPIAYLPEKLGLTAEPGQGGDFPLFDAALSVTNIHDPEYLAPFNPNVLFSFTRTGETVEGELSYNAYLYEKTGAARVLEHFSRLLGQALADVDLASGSLEMLTAEEKRQLLEEFNATRRDYPLEDFIHRHFQRRALKSPGNTALVWEEEQGEKTVERTLTYGGLDRRASTVAAALRRSGVGAGSVVGILMERSPDTIAALLGILKAGGAYLPIEPQYPEERIRYMLEDSGAKAVLTHGRLEKPVAYSILSGFENNRDARFRRTAPRPHIEGFNGLAMPDRSLIDTGNYRNKIGMASVTNCISIQTTRGCPYECLYCHKIWSKKHVYRTAESIYDEISYYYKKGVVNFAFIDDCFNLNRANSGRLFETIIENCLKVRLFFPNGLRGDIMTPDYIDRMAEAGTRGINLSLETGSPRLQKLLGKHLDLDRFKEVVDYIAVSHPEIMLEMASMHGFPTETEEEAMMTLDFIKDIRWLHFPYIHILKIFPNTEMEEFALAQGISKEDILISKDRAFHELPETLPFPKSFTRKYQADFLNEYFLNKERLLHVLPVQMNILSEGALVQKYNAYLPAEINRIEDIAEFAGLEGLEIPASYREKKPEEGAGVFNLGPRRREPVPGAKKIMLLDLSQHFSSHHMLYNVAEQPLGQIYLLTYLKQRFGDKIDGRIYKSGNDFDGFDQLKALVEEFQPELIGIRTLTFFKEFFHEAASLLRQWCPGAPIITGGPYASSDYDTILKDPNVDLVVLGEGEHTMGELMEAMLRNDFKLPDPGALDNIEGLVYPLRPPEPQSGRTRQVIYTDRLSAGLGPDTDTDITGESPGAGGGQPAYVMYTSGSTGRPKGVMVEHRQVNNCIHWMQEEFPLGEKDTVLQRTDLTFDPSVWEIFWPLYMGGALRVITHHQGRDADFLIRLMSQEESISMLYCPASLVNAMARLLEEKSPKPRLKTPWFLIGAEPIRMETIKTFYKYYSGRIVNTYGPTECTINNTFYPLEPGEKRSVVPIGRPVANNYIYILTPQLTTVPLQVPGEIYIAGDSLARGYVNNPLKTAECFIPNPFGAGKLYKTGDMGRWLKDGAVEIMGRADEQVKIRGYRIEPDEINIALLRHPAVSAGTVVVRDESAQSEPGVCTICGITTQYPGIKFSGDDGRCDICRDFQRYRGAIDTYFKAPADLKGFIEERNQGKNAGYHCLMVYNGGRGAAHALYRLVDMGFNVLPITYDNGYFGKRDLENIRKITGSLGLDHVVLKHKNTDHILRESMKTASTVCRGCFHTSASLAAQYAYDHDIPVVVGATLSRGQIIENKLFMFLQQGITAEEQLVKEIAGFQKNFVQIDKNMFDYIDIDVVIKDLTGEKVSVVDFYRYSDITNHDMIDFLNQRDPYWQKRKDFAIYSTNCPIKQLGDFGHLKERDFHYYGGATSWEKRLGHLTMDNIHEDLNCTVTPGGYENFIKRIGYEPERKQEQKGKYLCAYYVAPEDLEIKELREFLGKRLPDYMAPSHFVRLDALPLLSNGKIDKKALPAPDKSRARLKATYVAPGSDMEHVVADTWRNVLELDKAGIHDNFFDLGGTSMHIIEVGSRLRETVGKDIPVVTLFTYPTIHSLAQHLDVENKPEKIAEVKEKQATRLNKSRGKMKNTVSRLRKKRP